MAHARVGPHIVLVHGSRSPTDAEWQAYLADLKEWSPSSVGLLILSDRSGPSSAQRRALRDLGLNSDEDALHTAVVSSSLLVRGIVNAVHLFAPSIRVFAPNALAAALTYIRATPDEQPRLLAVVERLRRDLT